LRQRDAHRDPVGGDARIERVPQFETPLSLTPEGREIGGIGHRLGGAYVLGGETEGLLVAMTTLLPPGLQMPAGGDVLGQAVEIEGHQCLVVDHQIPTAAPRLQFTGLLHGLGVLADDRDPGIQAPFHDPVADEHLAGERGVDPGEQDPPRLHHGQSQQQHLLIRHRRTLGVRPVRFGVLGAGEVTPELFDPPRIDPGDITRPQPGRLDELGCHHPAGRLPGQIRPGEHLEPDTASAPELAGLLVSHSDIGEQTGQDRLVEVVLRGVSGRGMPPSFTAHAPQLGVEVLPLSDA